MQIRSVILVTGLILLLRSAAAWGREPPRPAPRIAAGAWRSVLNEHPRLLGPRSHLRALAAAKPDIYSEIKANKSLLAVGVAHAVEGVPAEQAASFIEAAKNVARGVTDIHQDTWIWLTEVALTFDLFYDALSPADRSAMIAWMNGHLEKYKTDEGAFHNSTVSKILCYLRIAYATWGENPRAPEFRDYALKRLYEGRVAPTLAAFGEGGGWTEAGWYARGSLWHLAQALELARRIEGYDGFQKAPRFFYHRLAYEMFQPYPGRWEYGTERFAVEGDGSLVYGGHTEYPRHLRTLLAQYFRGSPLARAVMNQRRKASNSEARLQDFLLEEEPETPLPLSGFPLAHLAKGIGKVYARSDWTDDATWLRFECGDFWNHHQHFEVGNFEIFRYAPLATESGEYVDYSDPHSANWLTRTIAHNSLLIYQPGETWPRMRDGGRNTYANDGGQAHKWEWPVATLAEWEQKRETFERGDIIAYENRPEYLFVAGDCTKAYAATKLSSYVRQIVFLRPGTIIVFDRVVSTRPEYEKTWLLHCRNAPEIEGSRFVVRDGRGRLDGKTLLPEKAALKSVSGYTYRGQTFAPQPSSQSAAAAKWRIEVQPSAPAKEDFFLHVLSTDGAKDAHLVREKGKVGVRVGNATVLFDGKAGGTLTMGQRVFPLARGVKKSP